MPFGDVSYDITSKFLEYSEKNIHCEESSKQSCTYNVTEVTMLPLPVRSNFLDIFQNFDDKNFLCKKHL